MSGLATATTTATDWIAGKLASVLSAHNVALYVAVAPENQPRPVPGTGDPYITLRLLNMNDRRFVGGRLAGTVVDVEVTAWDEGTMTNRIGPVVDAIHAALDRQRGSMNTTYISACYRTAPVERTVPEGDTVFTQLGGEYRVRVAAA